MDWLSHVQLPCLQSDQDKANFGALVDAIKESKAVSGPCTVVYNTLLSYTCTVIMTVLCCILQYNVFVTSIVSRISNGGGLLDPSFQNWGVQVKFWGV